ncbi:MAG TPA: ATP-binding cassette domain-containing protein [Ignavibacteriaceae bacterium]|nr:ATP-binding cassette domain-containing protein [Ignavibacteriaceae bacterium]
MLQVENLRKEYKNVVAVDNISFRVDEGRIFGILGPNGAGKTTTIRTVLNIIKPNSGQITFNGKPITNEFYNIIGYLPEERGLYRKSKVIDVIQYFAGLKKMPRKKSYTEAKFWLQKLEIEQYDEKRIEELSKGNQQKIQFIISVIHNPKLLILDEPFTGFDPISQTLIKELILSFVTSGKIIILSTHQMETAEKLCPDILLMNKGKEVYYGALNNLKRKFGVNTVKIEFEGDAEFIGSLPVVKNIDRYSNYAEVQLNENINPSEFLKMLIDRISIKHFSVLEPTLNKIFIDVIKQNQAQ